MDNSLNYQATESEMELVIKHATLVFKLYVPIGFAFSFTALLLLLLPYCMKSARAHPQGILMHLQFLQFLNSLRILIIGLVFRAQ